MARTFDVSLDGTLYTVSLRMTQRPPLQDDHLPGEFVVQGGEQRRSGTIWLRGHAMDNLKGVPDLEQRIEVLYERKITRGIKRILGELDEDPPRDQWLSSQEATLEEVLRVVLG